MAAATRPASGSLSAIHHNRSGAREGDQAFMLFGPEAGDWMSVSFRSLRTLWSALVVRKIKTMTDIRKAIMDGCGPRYCKVAMVISRASAKLGINDDEAYELIAREIVKLVADGELQAVGDLSDWRRSEVRLVLA